MDFIKAREYLHEDDIVIVSSDTQCNVMIMTDSELRNYRSGQRFHYHGGHYKYFPVRIAVPSNGYWNTVIDLGGGRANIRYGISYLRNTPAPITLPELED